MGSQRVRHDWTTFTLSLPCLTSASAPLPLVHTTDLFAAPITCQACKAPQGQEALSSRFLDVSLVPKQCLEHSCCCCLVAQLCMTLCDPKDCSRLLCPWNFPGKSAGVGCHFLLQEIFLTQGSNRHLLHWQVDSLSLSHQRSPPGTQCSVNIFCINQIKSFHQFPYQHCSLFCVPNRCCVLCLYHSSQNNTKWKEISCLLLPGFATEATMSVPLIKVPRITKYIPYGSVKSLFSQKEVSSSTRWQLTVNSSSQDVKNSPQMTFSPQKM